MAELLEKKQVVETAIRELQKDMKEKVEKIQTEKGETRIATLKELMAEMRKKRDVLENYCPKN